MEMGKREYSEHTFHRAFRFVNYWWMSCYRILAHMRPVGSRFLGAGNGPLNYSGLYIYFFATIGIFSRCSFDRARDVLAFNHQDGAEFWFERYKMMFPPSFLHNRMSAHYIEINNIFFNEMIKKYHFVRKDVLAERAACTEEERMTKYALNPNYIYEPLKADTPVISRLLSKG